MSGVDDRAAARTADDRAADARAADDRAAAARDRAADDRAADRRVAVSAAFLVVTEGVLASLADSGVIPLWLWSVLAVVAVGVTALLAAFLGRPRSA